MILDDITIASKLLAVCNCHRLVHNVLEAYNPGRVRRPLNIFGIPPLASDNHIEFRLFDPEHQLQCLSIGVKSPLRATFFKEVFLSVIIDCMVPQPDFQMLTVQVLHVNVGENRRLERLRDLRAHFLSFILTFAVKENAEQAPSWRYRLFFSSEWRRARALGHTNVELQGVALLNRCAAFSKNHREAHRQDISAKWRE